MMLLNETFLKPKAMIDFQSTEVVFVEYLLPDAVLIVFKCGRLFAILIIPGVYVA